MQFVRTRVEDRIRSVCGTTDRFTLLLRGGDVLRYHAEGRHLQPQSVAEHTWRMLVILLHLWPNSSKELILAVLYHDVAECYTGDFPRNSKDYPGLQAILNRMKDEFHDYVNVYDAGPLSELEYFRYKLVDILEVYITSKAQVTPRAKDVEARAWLIIKDCIPYLEDEGQKLVNDFLSKLGGSGGE